MKIINIPNADVYDPFAQFLDLIPWNSIDGFLPGGDGEYTAYGMGITLWLVTIATTDSDAYVNSRGPWIKILDVGKAITIEFDLLYLHVITNILSWMRFEVYLDDPPSETREHFGWKTIGGNLYASNSNGSTQKITDTGVDIADAFQRTRLKIILTPGTDIKFYVNDVLKVTHTEYLPDNTDYYIRMHLRTLDDVSKQLEISRILLQKAY